MKVMDISELQWGALDKMFFYIYQGLSNDIEKLNVNDSAEVEKIKELLRWYKSNILISYNSLEEKFNEVMNNGR